MSKLRYSVSMSLDGFVAGVDQSIDSPLGVGGDRLHEWVKSLAAWRGAHGATGGQDNASTAVVEEGYGYLGAIIMGRNMFGGGTGPWGDDPWRGWWGEDPPFHMPVFVLTHHRRAPFEMDGNTTFTFVTDGNSAALDEARRAANGKDVSVAGGASVAKQYLAAGLLDEIEIHLVPALLGDGIRLLDDPLVTTTLEQVRVVEAPGVTHLKYRIDR